MAIFNIPFGDTIMTRMHKTRIGSLLAIGLLAAVILPQQNAMGQTNRYGSNDATLSALTLSGIEFLFSPYKRLYKVYVDLTATTVAATPNDPGATVKIYSGPPGTVRSTANRGSQVALQEGTNYISVDVTSANGRISQTYLIDVTRTTTPPSEGGVVNKPGSVLHGRTRQVADSIISALGSEVTQYNQVTNLAQLNSITNLSFSESESIYTTSLQANDFNGLDNLQYLILSTNRLTALPAGVFDKLVNLKTLVLDYNRLTSLPSGIFDKLVNLKTLVLGYGRLTSLPSGIFDNLVNLQRLELNGNLLTTLPAGIFDGLVKLQILDLRDVDEHFDNWIASASAAAEIESLYEDDDFPHFRHVDVSFAATVSLTSSNVNIAEEGDDNNKAIVSVVANRIMFRGNVHPNRLSVEYSTQDGTAIADQDYTATSGTLTFQGNETNVVQTISIPILDDDITNEPDKTFKLILTHRSILSLTPTRAFFPGGVSQLTATVTITDDDDPPTVLLSSPVNAPVVEVAEGNEGTSNVEVPVQRIQASAIPTSIRYATQDGTAIAGQDYTATSGTLTFPAGTTNLTQTISIPIYGDTLDEPNEIFTVTLSDPTNSVIQPRTVRIEIIDDDEPDPVGPRVQREHWRRRCDSDNHAVPLEARRLDSGCSHVQHQASVLE